MMKTPDFTKFEVESEEKVADEEPARASVQVRGWHWSWWRGSLRRLRVKEIDVEISAAIVKKLRDATNAGMMDCKKR